MDRPTHSAFLLHVITPASKNGRKEETQNDIEKYRPISSFGALPNIVE